MRHTMLYLCAAALMMTGCWSEDDGEKNYQDKPERAVSATMEEAMGLLCELVLSTQEKGDTLLVNQKIELMDYDPYIGHSFGYEITANELHIIWETMPETNDSGRRGIGNLRFKGTGIIRTIEDYPLVMEFEIISDLLFKSAIYEDWYNQERKDTRLLSGAAHVKVSGGMPGDPPLEFLMAK